MSEEYSPVSRETFVVRLWREAASHTWRGQIVHLPDGRAAYFAALSQAEAFIAQFVPELSPGGAPPSEEGSPTPQPPL
jgi:hypothetical protein